MADSIMKVPMEPCPPEGWTIIDAIANCCHGWLETIERDESGRVLSTKLRVKGDSLRGCFNELRLICEMGMLRGKGRRSDPSAPLEPIPPAAWKHYEMVTDGLLNEESVMVAKGAYVFDVRLFLTGASKRGRSTAGEFIRAYCKARFTDSDLKKDNVELRKMARTMLKVFAREGTLVTSSGKKMAAPSEGIALSWLQHFAKYGLDTQLPRRARKNAK